MVPDLGEGSVCLLAGSITAALPHCSYHHFISNRKIGAPMEACGSMRLFLGYSYFSEFLFKSGPSRPTGGSCLFLCSLGACPGFMCAVVAGVVERERERKPERKMEEGNRNTPVVPLCPNLSQGDTLTSQHSATLPWRRRKAALCLWMGALGAQGTCWRRLLNQAAGETDVNVLSPGLKVQSWSHRLLLSEATRQRLPRILCLHSQWSGTTLPGPTEFTHTNPPICTSEHKELSPEKAIESALLAIAWEWQIRDVKQPGVGIPTKEAFLGELYTTSSCAISPGLGLSSSINFI